MAQMLQSRVQKFRTFISSLLLVWIFSWAGYAQTTLIPGDLLVVSLNGSNSTIEVVPLIDLEESTYFTIKVGSNNESMLDVLLKRDVKAGNTLLISQETSSTLEAEGVLKLQSDSDQISILQKDGEFIRILLLASWGNNSKLVTNVQNEGVPTIKLGEGANHQYYLKNGASGTPSMISRMISDPAHWKSSNQPYAQFRTSFRMLTAPVVVFNQNISTVMEGDSIPLNVAIYEHDGSRLTVDVVLNLAFSTADTNDINSFKTYTYNFTGLIGDAVYEIAIPQYDDTFFEDRETAFFELQNLTAGNFGDFVSHATFITDNEIPDVTITSIKDIDAFNEDYIVLQNNERVYVNINKWKIQTADNEFEIKNIVDLAPLEKRRILASDIVDITNERAKEFELSGEKFVLIDGFGNTITQFEQSNVISKVNEITEIVEDEISTELELTDNIVPQINTGNNQVFELEENMAAVKEGWYPVSVVNNQEQSNFIYWDERFSRFRETSTANPDSLIGLSFFKYVKPKVDSPEFDLMDMDTLFQDEMIKGEREWKITLSATDFDKNGIINGAEGYNFIQFRGEDSISVSNFITLIEDLIGENFIHPMVFKLDETQGFETLNKVDFLFKDEFLWLKADSLFEPVELTLQPTLNPIIDVQSELVDEPISNFRVSAKTQNGRNSVDFNFFDVESTVPNDVFNPAFNIGYTFMLGNSPLIGVLTDIEWKNQINSTYQQEKLISFPLGIINSESAEISLLLEDWNMEGGWRVFIEDTDSREKQEIFPGEEFKIEYSNELPDLQLNQIEDQTLEEVTINNRYTLLIASPEYEEVAVDSPEQIELYQNFPNPFNPATTITFSIPEAIEVKLSVFNVVGQPIAVLEEGTLGPGEHNYEWNAFGYPSGMYIYQLEVGNKVMTRKMTLVK